MFAHISEAAARQIVALMFLIFVGIPLGMLLAGLCGAWMSRKVGGKVLATFAGFIAGIATTLGLGMLDMALSDGGTPAVLLTPLAGLAMACFLANRVAARLGKDLPPDTDERHGT